MQLSLECLHMCLLSSVHSRPMKANGLTAFWPLEQITVHAHVFPCNRANPFVQV